MDTLQITAQAAARIGELLKANNWSQAELGRQTGIDAPHITRLLKAEKPTSLDTLTKVANALGVHTADLIRPDPVSPTGYTPLIPLAPPSSGGISLPFIGHVQAGGGIDEPADLDSAETVSVADTFRGASGVYRVRGKSMLGANIQEGDELIVKLNPDPASGDVVVAWKVKSGAMVKRFQQDSFHRYLLSEPGDGIPTDKRGVIPIDDGDRIIGVVVGIQRKYKPETTSRKGAAPATKAKKK